MGVAATTAPWKTWLARWVGQDLTGEEAAAFDTEISRRDIRRARALAMIQVVLHVAHILVYRISDSARATLSPAR